MIEQERTWKGQQKQDRTWEEGYRTERIEKRGKETVIAIKSSTGDAARQHVPPQNNGENAHYTTRETTRV